VVIEQKRKTDEPSGIDRRTVLEMKADSQRLPSQALPAPSYDVQEDVAQAVPSSPYALASQINMPFDLGSSTIVQAIAVAEMLGPPICKRHGGPRRTVPSPLRNRRQA
jgi:hypothetical protein